MTLWGVLLTSGVGNTSENNHTSFGAAGSYIDSAAGAGGSYIDSFFDSIENWLACMTHISFL
jgi:hypothetical protein